MIGPSSRTGSAVRGAPLRLHRPVGRGERRSVRGAQPRRSGRRRPGRPCGQPGAAPPRALGLRRRPGRLDEPGARRATSRWSTARGASAVPAGRRRGHRAPRARARRADRRLHAGAARRPRRRGRRAPPTPGGPGMVAGVVPAAVDAMTRLGADPAGSSPAPGPPSAAAATRCPRRCGPRSPPSCRRPRRDQLGHARGRRRPPGCTRSSTRLGVHDRRAVAGVHAGGRTITSRTAAIARTGRLAGYVWLD